jgi:hypothetical protein
MAAEFIAVELAVDSEGIDIVRVRANGCWAFCGKICSKLCYI